MENSGGPTDLRKRAAAGLLVGVMTGFLGVGGGFLIVPALVLFGGVEIGAAIGTSLLVIAINSAAGLAGQLRHHPIDLKATAIYTVIASIGTWLGARLGEAAKRGCMVRPGGRPFFDLQESGSHYSMTSRSGRKTDVHGTAFCGGNRPLFLPARLR